MSTNTTNGSAERRLKDLGVNPPRLPAPLGAYAEAVQTGNKTSTRLVFGMASLPVDGCVVLEGIFEVGN